MRALSKFIAIALIACVFAFLFFKNWKDISVFFVVNIDDEVIADGMRVFSDREVVDLVRAIDRGDLQKIKGMYSKGVNFNARGKDNITPLYWVLKDTESLPNPRGFVAALLYGADPLIENKLNGKTAFMRSAEIINSGYLISIIENNFDNVDYMHKNTIEKTALRAALSSKMYDNADILINAGSDINLFDEFGINALIDMLDLRNFESAFFLLERGADYHFDVDGCDIVCYINRRSVNYYVKSGETDWREKIIDFLRGKNVWSE